MCVWYVTLFMFQHLKIQPLMGVWADQLCGSGHIARGEAKVYLPSEVQSTWQQVKCPVCTVLCVVISFFNCFVLIILFIHSHFSFSLDWATLTTITPTLLCGNKVLSYVFLSHLIWYFLSCCPLEYWLFFTNLAFVYVKHIDLCIV